MNNLLINKIHLLFTETISLNETDSIKLRYMLELIINDALKLLIMLVFFSFTGRLTTFLYSLIAILLIRSFTGGLHFKSFWGCLTFSGVFFTTSIYFTEHVALTLSLSVSLYVFILLTTLFLAPITPSQRPNYSAQKRFQFKLVGIVVVILNFSLLLATDKNPYCIAATWVLFFQSIQLIIAGGVKYAFIKKTEYTTT